MTRHTKEYLEFRVKLDNRQLDNLKATLTNMLHAKELKEAQLTILELGSALRFHVYVDQVSGVLWLLGGHWVRPGEPSADFEARMLRFADDLAHGRVPE